MKKLGIGLVILSLFVGLFGWTAVEAAAPSLTCTGGAIPAGTYASLDITGACSIPTGTVTVNKGVEVHPNASLNAAVVGGGTLTVGRNLVVDRNAILVLGCGPDVGCTGTPIVDHVSGSILADHALSVILHNDTVDGNVVINAGGGGLTCAPNATLTSILSFPAPPYDDISDLTIAGNLTMSDVKSCWMGIIRNTVTGNVTVRGNTFGNPDADEIVANTIGKNLACTGNSPAPQVGDSGGLPNTVTGKKLGQCTAPGL